MYSTRNVIGWEAYLHEIVNMVVTSRCFAFSMLHVITQAQIWKSFWVENLTSLFNLYPFLHRLKLGKSLQNMLCPRLNGKTTYKLACIPSTVTYMYLQLFNKYSTGVHWIWDGRLQTRRVVTSWLSSHIQQAWVEWAIPENIHTIPRTASRISEGEGGGSQLWNSEDMGGVFTIGIPKAWGNSTGGISGVESVEWGVSSLKTLLLWTFVVRK